MNVRAATLDDLDTIVAFNAGLARETEDLALDTERLSRGVRAVLADPDRGRYRVAEEDGRPLGGLLVTLEWSDWRDGWFWWIQSVFVSPEARGRGVYRALHESLLAEARAADDVCGIRLYVDHDNTRAQAVYEALGMTAARYRMYTVDFVLGS